MTDIQEALTAAGTAALVQKRIDPMLLEYQRRYSPFVRALPTEKWDSTTYYFNTRTSRVPGGFVTDGGARPVTNSTYIQNKFEMAHLQAVGSVTGYAQEVTRSLIGDLQAREIDGAVQSLIWDIENALCWGSAAATVNGPAPMFDGLDVQVGQFSASGATAQNSIDEAGATLALRHLDQLIDLVETNAAAPIMGMEWMFVMSTTANSKLAQILTNQQRFVEQMGAGTIGRAEIAAGLIVPTYRDVPIVKSSFLGARGLSMGTVTASAGTLAGSTLAAGTYNYRVTAVIARLGEINASPSVAQAATAGQAITLAFTPPAGYEAAPSQLYKVYRSAVGGAPGTETLLGYVDANVGLSGDGVTPIVATSIIDNGATLIPANGATTPGNPVLAYVGTNAGHLPRTAGNEDLFLISRDKDNVVRPFVRDVSPIQVYPTTSQPDALPFAVVSDTALAVRGPKYVARARNVSSAL
jgi:hypothetical protein